MKLYTNDITQFPGLDLLPMTVNGQFWRAGEDKNELPDRDYFIERCQGDGPLCINVEHWHTDIRYVPHTEADDSIDKLCTLTRWASDAFPGRVIGHYRMFPHRDYWTTQTINPLRWHAWRKANGYIKKIRSASGRYNSVGLADLCHVTMPSLYTFYENQAGWVKYAKANIAEARKYGKPVIPFLWPRFHDSNVTLRLTAIPGDYWRLQLDTLGSLGVTEAVVWDAAEYYASRNVGDVWSADSPWIQETKAFI